MPRQNPSIDFQPRDLSILRGLFESRVMTSAHVAALYFDGRSEAAKKRLQKLKAAGLLRERPRRVYEPAVLFLTREGLRYLQGEGVLADYPRISLPQLDKRAQLKDLTLRHELDVMDVKTSIISALRGSLQYKVAEFTTWPLLIQFEAITPDGEKVTVKPDGFVRIHETDSAGAVFEHLFFVEVDRSSEVLETLATRAACYADYYRRGGLAVRHGKSRQDFKDFPFRVLMIFKNAERRNNMAERLLQNHPPILTQAILATIDDVRRDSLGSIWIQPADYRKSVLGTAFDIYHRLDTRVYRRQNEREGFVDRVTPRVPLL